MAVMTRCPVDSNFLPHCLSLLTTSIGRQAREPADRQSPEFAPGRPPGLEDPMRGSSSGYRLF
jgi:hypothetical protein